MKSILSFLWQVHHGEVCRFCRSVRGTVASFSNQDLTNKSWEVHLYCTLMACGDGMFVGEKSSINQIFCDFGKNGCVFRVP